MMDEDAFNMELRKFLKRVGVTSQKVIEETVREGLESGRISEGPVKARMVLTLDGLEEPHVVEGEIPLT